MSSKNTLFLVKACLIWPLAYFFPLSFWHIIIISSFLKHQKTNTRAFRSKGTMCPHIPSFILCFSFSYLSPFTSIHVCCLNHEFYYLVLFLRCQDPIEQIEEFLQTIQKLYKPASPGPTDQKKENVKASNCKLTRSFGFCRLF